MERFSPIYRDRESFPAIHVRPERSYSYVFPSTVNLDRVAYFFDYKLVDTLDDGDYADLLKATLEWKDAWRDGDRPRLTMWRGPDVLRLEDTRDEATSGVYSFEGLLAEVYFACSHKPISVSSLLRVLSQTPDPDELTEGLQEFCDRRLMMKDGESYLSLALPAIAGR